MSLCILEVVHWITLCLYCIVTVKTILLYPHVKQCPHKDGMGWIIYAYLTCIIVMTTAFMYLQVDWIVANYDSVVETDHAYLWALYDVINAFVQLFYLLGLEVWTKWKFIDSEGNPCLRRRRDDP
jgi:hypothetical protein